MCIDDIYLEFIIIIYYYYHIIIIIWVSNTEIKKYVALALSPYRLLQAMSYAGAHCSETRMTVVCILPRPKKHWSSLSSGNAQERAKHFQRWNAHLASTVNT